MREYTLLARFHLCLYVPVQVKARLVRAGVQVRGYSLLAYVHSPRAVRHHQQRQHHQHHQRHHQSIRTQSTISTGSSTSTSVGDPARADPHQQPGSTLGYTTFDAGDRVVLTGLVDSPEFNGRLGRVVAVENEEQGNGERGGQDATLSPPSSPSSSSSSSLSSSSSSSSVCVRACVRASGSCQRQRSGQWLAGFTKESDVCHIDCLAG